MAKVIFKYSIKEDAWSWVSIAKGKNTFGLKWREQIVHIPDHLLSDILKSDFSKAQDIVEKYLKTHPKRKYRKIVINEELNALKNIWSKVEKIFFNILSSATQKPIFANNFRCYLTTGFMCPYNEKENWFMTSVWHSLPFSITIICHELLHFQFLYYYKSYLKKKGLTNKQIEDLKESLTFLLNEPEFKEVILVKDRGYPNHQKLRKKFKQEWQKKKDFQKFLEKAVEIVKKDFK